MAQKTEPAQSGTVTAICISTKKGTAKTEVPTATLIENHGLEGDAHAGSWHRQVSLLSQSKVDDFKSKGASVENGAFGENILVQGIDLAKLPVGTKITCGGAVLEVTQIGKECHAHCEIYHQMGECIMPKQGIFARVLKGGAVKKGDAVYADKTI